MTPEFLAGIMNGISQGIIGHPLDTIKTLQQNKMNWFGLPFKNYYFGFTYPLYRQIIQNSLTFDINEKLNNNGIHNKFITGGITGFYISPILYYFDVLKIKKQTTIPIKFIDFINYKGLLLTTFKESIACSLYLGTYFKLKEYQYNSAISGGIAGVVNWSITYPIDIIKTRQITYNMSIINCIKYGSLWKGFITCNIRAFFVSSIGFTVYENTLLIIQKFFKK